jgi:hypothetical protein
MSITKLWDRIEQVNIEKNNVIVQHPFHQGARGYLLIKLTYSLPLDGFRLVEPIARKEGRAYASASGP